MGRCCHRWKPVRRPENAGKSALVDSPRHSGTSGQTGWADAFGSVALFPVGPEREATAVRVPALPSNPFKRAIESSRQSRILGSVLPGVPLCQTDVVRSFPQPILSTRNPQHGRYRNQPVLQYEIFLVEVPRSHGGRYSHYSRVHWNPQELVRQGHLGIISRYRSDLS